MPNQTELLGTFRGERASFVNDSDPPRVIIGEVRTADGSEETVKGPAGEGELTYGLQYRFWGHWTHHPKYGRQFAFQNFIVERPFDRGSIITYLSTQLKGIGSAIASRIYDACGSDALNQLRDDPESVAKKVKGLSPAKAKAASEHLTKKAGTERATAELLGVIHGRGFPRGVVDECLRAWGSRAAEIISRNPYHLLRFRGCGFLKADQLYSDLGLPPGTLKRQALCAHDAIKRNGNGDTWHSVNVVHNALLEKISGAAPNLEKTITLSTRGGLIAIRENLEGRWVADAKNAEHERRLSEYVARIVTDDAQSAAWPDELFLDVSDHQREIVAAAFQRRLGILAGRPGTGKTYVTTRIIEQLLRDGIRPEDIAVAAPTNKAALRLTQVLGDATIPVTATSIHSLLKVAATDGGTWFFEHGHGNHLDIKYLFIDEASMLDANLGCQLFSAIGPHTSVLLIGDTNQLPPVGHGAPLRDFIAAGVPCGELTEIRRNSGRIVSTCKEIVEQRKFTSSKQTDLESGENLPHVEWGDDYPIDVTALIQRLAEKYDVDPLSGIQVLVATNRLRKQLNKRLQESLNPSGRKCEGTVFRVGDKVINLKNSSFSTHGPDMDENGAADVAVANGEQGVVLAVSPGRMIVRLDGRDLDIVVRWKRSYDEDESSDSDDRGQGCSWDLAYAISVHKSQGSEWPICIVIVDSSGGRIQSRNWTYTAVSRAKLLCVTVGKRQAIEQAVRRDGIRRKTFLCDLIKEEVQRLEKRSTAEFMAFEADNEFWGVALEGVM